MDLMIVVYLSFSILKLEIAHALTNTTTTKQQQEINFGHYFRLFIQISDFTIKFGLVIKLLIQSVYIFLENFYIQLNYTSNDYNFVAGFIIQL